MPNAKTPFEMKEAFKYARGKRYASLSAVDGVSID